MGRGCDQTEMAFVSRFPLKLVGSQALELRFDIFNLFNKKNTTGINNIIGLDPSKPPATFGTVTAVAPQRQAQVAVRYRF